jgi:hypothetical protein
VSSVRTYQGAPLVKGKRVTGFTDGEEEEMHLTHVVPFLVEEELMRPGAIFEKKADWQPFRSLMAVSPPDRIRRPRPSRRKMLSTYSQHRKPLRSLFRSVPRSARSGASVAPAKIM